MGLFGGGTQKTTTQVKYSPVEQTARNEFMTAGQNAFNAQLGMLQDGLNPIAKPAQMSNLTFEGGQNVLNHTNALQDTINPMLFRGLDYGLNGAMDVNNNPFLQGAIDAAIRPVMNQFTDPGGELSRLRSGSIGNGAYGGTRQGLAEGVAAGRLADTIAGISSSMSSSAFDKGQDTFARTMALAPATMQSILMPGQAQMGLGQVQEGFDQNNLNYEAALRDFQLNSPFIPAQNYANLINGSASPATQVSTGKQSDPLSSGISSAMGGMSMAMAGANPYAAAAMGLASFLPSLF